MTDYALDVIDLVRNRVGRDQPLSTRAALIMLSVSQAHALVEGRPTSRPTTSRRWRRPCSPHRLLDATNGDLLAARNWVYDFVGSLPVPPSQQR